MQGLLELDVIALSHAMDMFLYLPISPLNLRQKSQPDEIAFEGPKVHRTQYFYHTNRNLYYVWCG